MTRESAIKIVLSMEVEPNSTNFLVKTGEKYSGITRVLPNLLDMLSKYKIPVTWFITHDYWSKIDQEFPQLVDRMHDNGEIGCHVHFRKEKEIYLTDYNFQMELIGRATYFLRDKGFNVTSFRGGNFFFDENTLKVLEELNFEIDSSVVPGLYLKPYPALTIDHKERISNEPYFPSYANHCIPGKSKILEVPISICPYFKFNGKTISVLMPYSISKDMMMLFL